MSGGFGLCPQPRGYLYASRPVLRTICSAAQGGHTGLPFFAYIKNGKVEIVEDSLEKRRIVISKLNHSQ